ncbi:MAG: aldehyde dehydrogenase family protein [Myxococcales bacterium]|nr:aldehyde dehydrogenase family protein [Myxococcales bacterium]
MSNILQTRSPIDLEVFVERSRSTEAELEGLLERASRASTPWRRTPLAERLTLLEALVQRIVGRRELLAEELTRQMGRPIRHTPGEIDGFAFRARSMLGLAEASLAEIRQPMEEGFVRFIRREPHGICLVLSPWNYPWLTAVNAVIPALAAGNVVLLKHSEQTPLVAERIVEAGKEAGLPEGVLSYVHASHELMARAVADPRVAYVAFTGSVEGGRAIHRAGADRFIPMGLELGGKDPAYVRADADLERTAENLVDGAFYNAGQSCCAIERIYVHRDIYPGFVEAFVEITGRYALGDPMRPETTLGPLARERGAALVQAQVQAAIAAGARAALDPSRFPSMPSPYLAPQVLVDVDDEMELMREETFGPAIGIMAVDSDEEAIARMNASRYGLTASVWTADLERAQAIGDEVETGTFFLNRCDYLDPHLAWVGVKDSGMGCTLSSIGYEHLTRPKSYHLRLVPG